MRILFTIYIFEGNVQCEYFEMVELHGASAEQIKTSLLGSLKNRSAFLLPKLTIFDSDGFSVMFDIDGGVGTLLRGSADECGGEKALVEYLLQLHCFAQKLQLGVAEGLDTPEMRVINRLLSGSYGVFSHSGKRCAGLEKVYDELKVLIPELDTDGKMKSIKRHIAVRWLSRSASIDSLIEPLGALVSFIHKEKAHKSKKRKATDEEGEDEDDEIGEAGRMSLGEFCSAYGQFAIVAMLHFLGDVCEQLAVASKAL